MRNLKLVLLLTIALTTIVSCSKNDDKTPTFQELIVENSPWKFDGVALSNIINNSTEEFDKDKYELKIRLTNENTYYVFKADGTGEVIDDNVGQDIDWKIVNENQLSLTVKSNQLNAVFINLNVTETQLEFLTKNMKVATEVKADVKYLLSKSK